MTYMTKRRDRRDSLQRRKLLVFEYSLWYHMRSNCDLCTYMQILHHRQRIVLSISDLLVTDKSWETHEKKTKINPQENLIDILRNKIKILDYACTVLRYHCQLLANEVHFRWYLLIEMFVQIMVNQEQVYVLVLRFSTK